jgi:hypothetical protein
MSTIMIVLEMPNNQLYPGQRSFYDLASVRIKIAAKKFNIKPNAWQCAYTDFGWGITDILEAYLKIRPFHFFKSEQSNSKFPTWLDFYKGRINNEDIYTHFYIDDENGYLVINSFKRC